MKAFSLEFFLIFPSKVINKGFFSYWELKALINGGEIRECEDTKGAAQPPPFIFLIFNRIIRFKCGLSFLKLLGQCARTVNGPVSRTGVRKDV